MRRDSCHKETNSRVLINSRFGVSYSNFSFLTPTFWKVSIEKYGKTPTFSGWQHFTPIFKILVRTLKFSSTVVVSLCKGKQQISARCIHLSEKKVSIVYLLLAALGFFLFSFLSFLLCSLTWNHIFFYSACWEKFQTTFWIFLFLYFPENRLWHFMQKSIPRRQFAWNVK